MARQRRHPLNVGSCAVGVESNLTRRNAVAVVGAQMKQDGPPAGGSWNVHAAATRGPKQGEVQA